MEEWKKGKYQTSYSRGNARTTRYKNTTIHRNSSGMAKIESQLKHLELNHIRYGIVDSVTYPTGDPNGRAGVYVAEIWKRLEYGHATITSKGAVIIPPRPLFKVHLQTNGATDFKKVAKEVLREVFRGGDIRDSAWAKIGLRMKLSLRFTLETYKGFKPLVLPKNSPRSPTDFYDDTGFLKNQISYRVMPLGLPLGGGSNG